MPGNSVATVDTFSIDQRKARAYSESTLVPEHLRGNLANCLAAMMMADEMGESRLMVMQNIFFVHDRPGWIAAFMVARANRSGKFIGPLRYRTLADWPETEVECYGYLKDAPEDDRVVSMKMDMKTARESGWTTYRDRKTGKIEPHTRWATPKAAEQQLRWRSATWLIRLYAPECMFGLPTKEELEDISSDMIDVTPPMPKLSDFAPPVKGKAKEQNPAEPPAGALSGPVEAPQAAGAGERTPNPVGNDHIVR